jgi:hypothetical protein
MSSAKMVRLASGVAVAALIVGGCGKSEKLIAEENCRRVVAKFAAGKNASLPYDQAMTEFDRMKTDAETGVIHCKKAGMTDAVTALENAKVEIERQKEAGREVAAKEAAAAANSAQVANATKREAEWPKTQDWIKNRLVEAKEATAAGDWTLANAKLAQASDEFDTLADTKIAGTATWSAVKKEIDTTRARIQPHIAQREEAKNAAAASDAVRGAKPDERSVDGCNMRCEFRPMVTTRFAAS